MIQLEYLFNMLNDLRTRLGYALVKNSMTLPLGKKFLKYGSVDPMYPNWTDPVISDQDHYTGYGYASITLRSNRVAYIAKGNIHTETKLKDVEFEHPYLTALRNSTEFSEFDFWKAISTYNDLQGEYFLHVLRGKVGNVVGDPVKFELLNPYEITKVVDANTGEIGGYLQTRDGKQRTFPTHMIIPIQELNPFSDTEPYALTDAAKGSQFTLKTAEDYTRHALRNGINTPGIITTAVELDSPSFENFKKRILGHDKKGEPVFGNGAGVIDWKSIDVNLQKSGLKDINEMSRELLFAVSGVSKTKLGIEQSGVTRDTARVQKEQFIEDQILPRIQLIVDSLNLDYKRNYPFDYAQNGALIVVDNPVGTDHEAELKEVEMRDKKVDLYDKLIAKGYTSEIAAKYAKGDMDIDELGEPTEEVETEEVTEEVAPKNTVIAHNDLVQDLIAGQQSTLQNAITNIEASMTAYAINRIGKKIKNAVAEDVITEENDVITKTEKERSEREIVAVLMSFYAVVFALRANQVAQERQNEYGVPTTFDMTNEIRDMLHKLSKDVAHSHVSTVSNDIYNSARESALKGYGQQQIISELNKKFAQQISEVRARTIARTETNRAFTLAQFEADTQFVQQNGLVDRAYKKWTTRSSNPCPYCQSLASEDAIPFFENFRDIGGTVTVGKGKSAKSMKVSFMDLEAGNAHPNCQCYYQLIIRKEKL
jgi:hypothetical protein